MLGRAALRVHVHVSYLPGPFAVSRTSSFALGQASAPQVGAAPATAAAAAAASSGGVGGAGDAAAAAAAAAEAAFAAAVAQGVAEQQQKQQAAEAAQQQHMHMHMPPREERGPHGRRRQARDNGALRATGRVAQ